MLARLKVVLETLRLLAGEAHERQEPPVVTWVNRGKRAQRGNALKLMSIAAKAAGERRLAQRKGAIERLAEEAGIKAEFHLRIDLKGILPWPPADVLALLPAFDIEGAVITLADQAEQLRSLVDSSIHLTIMPSIEGVAFPALAKSGHQTFFPDAIGATTWVDKLGLPHAPSVIAGLFGELMGLAGELGAMDQKSLGIETRPEEEIATLRSLEIAFTRMSEELMRRIDGFDPVLKIDVSDLIRHLRTGEIDFAGQAQAAIDGTPNDIVERAGFLSLLLIESEFHGGLVGY